MDKLDPSHEIDEPEGLKPENELPQPEGLDPEHELEAGSVRTGESKNSENSENSEKSENSESGSHNLAQTREMREGKEESASGERMEKIEEDYKKNVEPSGSGSSKMKLILAAVFAIFATLAVLFYFFSDQIFKEEEMVVPPTIVPTQMPTPTVDPTASWQIYNEPEEDFSFRYPSDMTQWSQGGFGSSARKEFGNNDYTLTFESRMNYSQATGKPYPSLIEAVGSIDSVTPQPQTIQTVEGLYFPPHINDQGETNVRFAVNSLDGKSIYLLTLEGSNAMTDADIESLMNQIISTIQFQPQNLTVGLGEQCLGRTYRVCATGLTCQQPEGSASDTPGTCVKDTGSTGVACTMDAKICPDGSAVGRVAPNCEFAPCPGN